jgi:hypothetical protein
MKNNSKIIDYKEIIKNVGLNVTSTRIAVRGLVIAIIFCKYN